MGLHRFYGSLLVLISFYASFGVLMDPYRFLCVFMCLHWSLQVLMRP